MATIAPVDKTAVGFEGRLTVERSGEIQRALLDAVSSGGPLSLDLARATEMDITFLQLLYAAHAELRRRGTALVLPSAPPPAMAASLRAAGICRHAGTCDGSSEPCRWTGTGEDAV